MNLIQAMVILNENRPDRPRSLDGKKLQEAIDTINEYVDGMREKYKYRCNECIYYSMAEAKTKPYKSGPVAYCNFHKDSMDPNLISCDKFRRIKNETD